MADTSAEADIRGINIDKLVKGFADEQYVFKNFVTVSKTSAREIRWYQKGVSYNANISAPTTTGITTSGIANTSFGSLPIVAEQKWTRNTSHVRKYFVESPWITIEDINDSDVDVLATNVRDLVRAVASQVDQRIYNIITESQSPSLINTAGASGTGWDDATNGNPIADILTGTQNIRSNGYDTSNYVIAMDSLAHKQLMVFLITTKGSSIPNFSSEQVNKSVVMNLLGGSVLVSENVVTDSVALWIPNRAASWKSFMPMMSAIKTEEGIGKKIRVWEEGEAILTDPKAVHLITDTTT
jgi:hypothetical protein